MPTDDTRLDPLREWRLIHDLDVDFEAGVVRCKCGNFAGTTTFMEHLSAALAASGVVTLDVERARDMAETLCFLAGHGQEHPDHPSCPKNRHEADRIVRALSARRDFSARLSGVTEGADQ